MQLSSFELIKKGVSTIIDVVDAFARRELIRLENLINNLATVARTGSYNDLIDKPVIPTPPELSEVAYTGEYDDLLNKPTLFSGNYNDLTNKPNLSAVATSGSYNDLNNKPTIPSSVGELSTTTDNSGTWNRTKVGSGYGILTTTLPTQSPYLDTAFGNLYYTEAIISIPSDIRLNTPISCNVTPIGDGGLFCQIRSFSNSTITMFVIGPAVGSYNIRFSVEMFGSL